MTLGLRLSGVVSKGRDVYLCITFNWPPTDTGQNNVSNASLDNDFRYGSEVCGEWSRFKNGNPRDWWRFPLTMLRACQLCGFTSTPRKVQPRNAAASFELTEGLTPVLCMACWNRLRVLVKAQDMVNAARRAANKLRRLADESRRQENISRVA